MNALHVLALLVSAFPLIASAQVPELELEPIEVEAGDLVFQVDVGRLRVPENRSDPDTRTIELGVAILRSTSDEPGPPLLYLAGGPGNSATRLVSSPTWGKFLAFGDVILMDQRGVGESRPNLIFETDAMRPELLFGNRDGAIAHMVEIGELAAQHYDKQGVDLTGYHTLESADDVEDLRLVLGEEKLRLLGHSYGTHLGLAILRRHGASIDRFISIGSAGTGDMHKLPSELDQSLRELSALIEADPRWADRFPDFYSAVGEVLEGLEEEPFDLEVRDPRTDEKIGVTLGKFGLQLILLADLADTNDLPIYPRLIASIEERDPRIVAWFLEKRMSMFASLPVFTFVCRGASGATQTRWERIRREASSSPFGSTRTLFSPEIDRALGTPDLGDAFRAPVTSDVPTLFVSGTLDASTPPHQAERIRAGLPRSGHLIVEWAGHDDILQHPGVHDRICDFLAGGEPADERLSSSPLRFVGPEARVGHPSLEQP